MCGWGGLLFGGREPGVGFDTFPLKCLSDIQVKNIALIVGYTSFLFRRGSKFEGQRLGVIITLQMSWSLYPPPARNIEFTSLLLLVTYLSICIEVLEARDNIILDI